MESDERWYLDRDGSRHWVRIAMAGGLGRRVTWTLEGRPVTERTTHEDRVVLDGGEHGAVAVRLPLVHGPARRVTWWPADEDLGAVVAATTGLGGVDLDPAAGSAAAEREAWIREHPRGYTLRQVGTRSAVVLATAVLAWLLTQVVVPAVPWPEIRLPRIPWPVIPWPEIPWPEIPWPEIRWPDWSPPPVPDWLRELLRYAQFIWPVVLAAVLARAEIRRRRRQDAAKQTGHAGDTDPKRTASHRTASDRTDPNRDDPSAEQPSDRSQS